MTDDDAIETIQDVCAMRSTDAGLETLATSYGIERLRAAHALMSELLPIVERIVCDADERELDEARARVAEIEKRLKKVPAPRAESPPSAPLSDYAQTDAGMGIGGGREPEMSAQDLRDELAELRERTREKRARRGV